MSTKYILRKKRYEAKSFKFYHLLKWHAYNFYRFILKKEFRIKVLNRLRYNEKYLQHSFYTSLNRYPELFSIAAEFSKNIGSPKILSFGCSTGEECESIAHYIPHAHIVGVDINQYCLKKAKSQYQEFKFYHALNKDYHSENEFDLIFALAVFQHPENRQNPIIKVSKLEFKIFEDELRTLDQKLKPGGLLFIDHTDFNFMQTQIFKNYQIYSSSENLTFRNRPLFNKEGNKIAVNQTLYRVFQKKKTQDKILSF